ncbi:MAG: AarF/UbiB family protein [Candidatus Pacearchaeota archaeon]|nr:AarF/UbiB family protein [Candidatus Pacearchaeota archaeon]
MSQKLIAQAAEAIILQDDSKIIKRRIAKGYRLPILDEKLRKLRTRSEAKIIEKLSTTVNVPKILNVDEKTKEITMDFIQGKKLSDNLESLDWKKIAKVLGQEIAKIHDSDLIHGDLTTSNMIYVDNSELINKPQLTIPMKQLKKCQNSSSINNNSDFKIFFIDFGLGYHSSRFEDKAVDLHLLKQALEAKHFTIFQYFFKILLENYNSKDRSKILEQLKKVEARGRYKH